jgi:hypothetical protein
VFLLLQIFSARVVIWKILFSLAYFPKRTWLLIGLLSSMLLLAFMCVLDGIPADPSTSRRSLQDRQEATGRIVLPHQPSIATSILSGVPIRTAAAIDFTLIEVHVHVARRQLPWASLRLQPD